MGTATAARALPPARRLLAALLCVAALLGGCREALQARLSENDANEMLDALYSAGLAATKISPDGKTWSIEVERDDLQRALRVTREAGLPRQQFASTGELFKKEGLVSTPSEERIRYIYAVSQELAHTLSQIDGVVTARVHPVIPENDPLVDKVRPASASVFIKHRRGANLQAMAPAIRNLVMRGIEGLGYDNIALTFVAAEEPPRAVQAAAPPAAPAWPLLLSGVLGLLLLVALGVIGWQWRRARRLPVPATAAPPLREFHTGPESAAMHRVVRAANDR